ncbi:hypothetical protein [Chryseobacterium sp. Hurlbut01]|uniref:hypothetical protein n=1 Tax=Chryseobacterium sp. Hurlbut01 TaxID=1681828 RepID=UPI00128D31F8|nr:hypothetical protein [Chryseobacterium sp. Hurlbut01]
MPQKYQEYTFTDDAGTDDSYIGTMTTTLPVTAGTCVTAADDSYTVPVGGSTTASVLANDNYRGGGAGSTTPSNVTVTGVTVPAGFTVNANGTITVGAGVTAGSYTLTYQICDSQVATGDQVCSTATVTITVNAPCTNSGVTSVNLNSMYTGTLPANVVLEWWTSADRLAPGVKVTNPTAVTASGRYYVFFYDTVNLCYNTDLSTSYVDVSILPPCACTNNPATGGSNHDTKMGITLLKRAGAENADNWPMVRKSGHIALESNTQGFVVTRMTTAQLTAIKDANNAVEGMMSYDTDAKCLKIYDGTDWKCFSTPSCP